MNTLEMLESLAESWDVKLTSHEVGPCAHTWELRITGPSSWHLYRGALASVVARAWAGEPSDARSAGAVPRTSEDLADWPDDPAARY